MRLPPRPRCGSSRRRRRHQLVLEIFLHDRLARRLDGGARGAGAADRPPAGQSRDLGADACRRSPRRPPSTAAPRWRRSSTATRRTAASCSRACRRPGSTKILPVDGAFYLYADVSRFSVRQLRFRQAHAGGDARRGDAGRRFRSGAGHRTSSASATPARPPRCTRRSSGSRAGSHAESAVNAHRLEQRRHCERSEAIQIVARSAGLLRRLRRLAMTSQCPEI